jgi:ketosteroid isomerase-like protein
MSQENVEVVREALEALNRGDVEVAVALFDSDIEWWHREDDPAATVHRGHDGITSRLVYLREHFSKLQGETKELIECAGSVVVPLVAVGRGRSSGAAFQENEVLLFRLRDGKTTEVREYREKAEALKAVGLMK